MYRIFMLAAWLLAALPLAAAPGGAALAAGLSPDLAAGVPQLRTNQHFVDDISAASDLDIEDKSAVFDWIFAALPQEVRVYPTENYYYFRFYHHGVEYAGNFRLAAIDRDQGVLHFAYFANANNSSADGEMHYSPLTAADGVTVTRKDRFDYEVGHGGKTVLFHLNDLSAARPPEGFLAANETYLGPVFDESGIGFFLVFNKDLSIFHYLLDETRPVADELLRSEAGANILIGRRTGFAFFFDEAAGRKILIGVNSANVIANNYYDGPFDQLPDNFIEGDTLKDAIEAWDPEMAGQVNRFGYLKSGEGRYLIGPYLQYSEPSELSVFQQCADNPALEAERRPGCFAIAPRPAP